MMDENIAKLEEKGSPITSFSLSAIDSYLEQLRLNGTIHDYGWVSSVDALAAYDFWIDDGKQRILVGVKTTKEDFDTPFNVWYNELLQMSGLPERYDIYYLSQFTGKTAKLSIAKNVGEIARKVMDGIKKMPAGVYVDVAISPSILPFEPPITINLGMEE